MTPYRDITDDQWQRVAPLLPELRPRSELRGRPLANTRAVLNGVLWVMFSGATWSAMPRKYPSYQTCHRRFKAWHQSGVLNRVLSQLFGEAGEKLCHAMQGRMRTHNAALGAEYVPEPTATATTVVYGAPANPAAAPVPFNYVSAFKHAA